MNYAVQSFDLAVDRRGDAAQVVMRGGSVLQVVAFPASAQDVALALDDGDFVPVTGLLRLELRTGLFSRIKLRNAPTAGTLYVYTGTDPYPFVSGGAASGEVLLPDWELLWMDPLGAYTVASAFPQVGKTRWGDANPNFWGAPFGAGVSGMAMWKGRLCGTLAGIRAVDSPVMCSPLLERPIMPGFKVSPALRVWRLHLMISRSAVSNLSVASGIQLAPLGAGGWGWINAGNPGVGIFGDGAGGWQFVSKLAAGGAPVGFSEIVPLVWPGPVTEWATVDLEVVSASADAEAKLNLYLNARPTLTRSWGPGTVLPSYAAPANATRFVAGVYAGDNLALGALQLAAGRVTIGRTLLNGQEA